jgi:hypothetical protein
MTTFSKCALVALGLLLAATPSRSAGINLFWNDCSIGPTAATNENFACNTNIGSHLLVASFDPPPGNSRPNIEPFYLHVVVDLQSAAGSLPQWWRFKNANTCRQNSLVAISSSTPGSCPDPFNGQAIAGFLYYEGFGGVANRARILVSSGTIDPTGYPVYPGTEYYAVYLIIRNNLTVGPDSCSGCSEPACLVLNEITIYEFDPETTWTLTNPLTSNFVTWQGGAIGGAGCPGATPAPTRTWGQIKTLYR